MSTRQPTRPHRASVARTRIAERVRITNGPVTRTTNLVRCTICDEVITYSRGRWYHDMPEGTVELVQP